VGSRIYRNIYSQQNEDRFFKPAVVRFRVSCWGRRLFITIRWFKSVMAIDHDTHPNRSCRFYTFFFLFSFFFDILIFLSFFFYFSPLALDISLDGRKMYERRTAETFFDALLSSFCSFFCVDCTCAFFSWIVFALEYMQRKRKKEDL